MLRQRKYSEEVIEVAWKVACLAVDDAYQKGQAWKTVSQAGQLAILQLVLHIDWIANMERMANEQKDVCEVTDEEVR